MRLQVRNVGNAAIIACAGDIDMYSSARLKQALLKELHSEAAFLLVNMGEVSYLDSSGVATLVEGLQLSRETKKGFGLFALRPNARAVLELARLLKIFTVFETEQEALERIEKAPPFEGN